MSARHTPGPWQVAGTRHTGDLKIGPDARLHMIGPDGDAVAAVFYDMRTGIGWQDAKLIAAAPELFELAIQYRDDLRHPPAPDSIKRRQERIGQVLAKIGGEA